MSKKDNRDITAALAGVFQAAALVEQLAKTGYIPSAPFNSSIETLFVQNPDSTLAVFNGDISNIEHGLKVMADLLHHHQNREYPDTLRYVLGILHLQKKLSGNKDMQGLVGQRLEQARHQADHFGVTHDNVIANLASIYTDTLSTFRFRIQVVGDFTYLQQDRIASQVRALLFAGVRSATLWRQVGGTRLQMILGRKRLATTADALLRP